MAETFVGSFKVSATGTLSSSADLSVNTATTNYLKTYSIANGTGADMANNTWSDTRTISASSSDSLDLSGVLVNAFGTTLAFTKIKGFIIYAYAANTNNVLVGGDANGLAGWVGNVNDIVVVRPGGCLAIMANVATAYAVTASTGDILKILLLIGLAIGAVGGYFAEHKLIPKIKAKKVTKIAATEAKK